MIDDSSMSSYRNEDVCVHECIQEFLHVFMISFYRRER